MMQEILCEHCHIGGPLPLQITFAYKSDRCEVCNHVDSQEVTYLFCNADCMVKWLQSIDFTTKMSLPCPWCKTPPYGLTEHRCELCFGTGFIQADATQYPTQMV